MADEPMPPLDDVDLDRLLRFAEDRLDWDSAGVFAARRMRLHFLKIKANLRLRLQTSPESFGVTTEELKLISKLSIEGHPTEPCEERFREGLMKSLFPNSLWDRQMREHNPYSGQTISDKGNQAPMQVSEKKRFRRR